MKLNTKIFISSIALFCLCTASVVTSTFAWFAVNKTASMTVGAAFDTDADIDVGLAASGGFESLDYHEVNEGKITLPERKLTDVSGQGTQFFKPIFASDNYTFSATETIDFNSVCGSSNNQYFILATLKFRSDKPYSVYLGATDPFGILTGKLAPCAKIALFDGGSLDAEEKLIPTSERLRQIIYDGNDDDYYLKGTGATNTDCIDGEGALCEDYGMFSELTTGVEGEAPIYRSDFIPKVTSYQKAIENGLNILATMGTNGDTYSLMTSEGIKFYPYYECFVNIVIWIEGCDPDCVIELQDESLGIKLNFAFTMIE